MPTVLWIPVIVISVITIGIVFAILFGSKVGEKGLMVTDTGLPIRWDMTQGKLMVFFSPTLSADYREHWDRGRRLIEGHVGRQLFMQPQDATPDLEDKMQNESDRRFMTGIVYVCDDEGTAPEHGRTELTWDSRTGFIRAAYVRLPEAHSQTYGFGITLHEQLHTLGFDHDASPHSIMYPSVTERPGDMSSADVKLAKAVYAAA